MIGSLRSSTVFQVLTAHGVVHLRVGLTRDGFKYQIWDQTQSFLDFQELKNLAWIFWKAPQVGS